MTLFVQPTYWKIKLQTKWKKHFYIYIYKIVMNRKKVKLNQMHNKKLFNEN